MEFELLDPSDIRWTQALGRIRHDFFHLPGYVGLEAQRLAGEPRAAWLRSAAGELLVPLIVRDHPFGGRDALSPYGYPGPVTSLPAEAVRGALDGLWAGIGAAGIECVFIRCHSWAGPDLADMKWRDGEWLVHHGNTVTLDLTRDEDELFMAYRGTTRNLVRRLARDGYEVVLAPWARCGEFLEIYTHTMRRLDASSGYFFDRAYLDGLKAELQDGLGLFLVVLDGKTTAAGLATSCDGSAQYYLSGALPEYARASPTRLMVDAMWRWAKRQGAAMMNLGGGLGGQEDSLFKFKAGFSKGRAAYYTLRVVTQSDLYRGSVAAWEEASGRTAVGPSDFFPPYRAALETPST